jgi:N-acetylmuramoyl-L-alanine amidase
MRLLCGILLALTAAGADASVLRDLRVSDGPDSTRVVVDLGTHSDYSVFTLNNPDRVVIDLPEMQHAGKAAKSVRPKGVVRGVRTGPHDGGLRLVLDVSSPVDPKSFGMEPGGGYGYRLIVDLYPQKQNTPSPSAVADASAASNTAAPETGAPAPAQTPAPAATESASADTAVASAQPAPAPILANAPATARSAPAAAAVEASATKVSGDSSPRASTAVATLTSPSMELHEKQIVVAIDAGHGGDDPGAHGPHGLLEKDVTLSVARRLAHLINSQPGMRAVLTRNGDYYVGLRERTEKARKAQADLFVSIHCNALRDARMRGAAVYVLSDHGATNEQSRWLANRENAADLVGGVDLHDKDNQVAAVLIDISQTATMEASFDLGGRMLDSLGRINVLQKPQVQQAGFMVLKSPDIPSVLVETAYITNDREERLLGSNEYQDKLASSLLDGVRGYFSNYRPQQQVATAPESVPERAKAIPVRLASGGESASARAAVNFSK